MSDPISGDATGPAAAHCPECGAPWPEGRTCSDDFRQLLAWEFEDPRRWDVHHLMVLCYHIQHPSLYSPGGLHGATELLGQFLEQRLSPGQVRRRIRRKVDSGKRSGPITARPGAQGAYAHPVAWRMTAAQVVEGGANAYCDNVRAWAESTLATLKASGNLEAP
jgi:predicted nucleic acid-binding Zn ribbon protein